MLGSRVFPTLSVVWAWPSHSLVCKDLGLKSEKTIQRLIKELDGKWFDIKRGKAFFDMLGVFAEFETNLRRERQAEGIANAKAKGVYKGRPAKIDKEEIKRRLDAGERPTDVARDFGVSRTTVYKEKGSAKGRSAFDT